MSAHEERERIAQELEEGWHSLTELGALAARIRALPVADDTGELIDLRDALAETSQDEINQGDMPYRVAVMIVDAARDLLAKRGVTP